MPGPVLTKLHGIVENNAGLLLIVAAEAFYAFMNVSVKVLTTGGADVPILEILFLRMIVTYVGSITYMYYAKINYPILGPPEIRHLLVCRGFSGFFGIWGIYYSLQYLSLSDAVVLTFLSPLCTAIAGAILLKEKFTKIEALSGIISLLGTVLIARPPFIFDTLSKNSSTVVDEGTTAEQRVVAVGVALIGVLGITGACITIRAAGKRAHLLHNMAYFSGTCIIVSTIAHPIRMAIPRHAHPNLCIWLHRPNTHDHGSPN
ncbi:hypothetical protein AX15_000746 [Amanita polypyramis BW_CC]|nr:hypothetical protein AX15_000746 [Amanita polypyramis BW_CC]